MTSGMDTDAGAQAPDLDSVVRLCAEILNASSLTPEANFIESGGDSLSATLLSALIYAHWQVSFDAFQVLSAENIRDMHGLLSTAFGEESPRTAGGPDAPARSHGATRPSLNQIVRLQMDADLIRRTAKRYGHNLALAFRAKGHLDVERLRQALHQVAGRHDTLRSVFRSETEVVIHTDVDVDLTIADIDVCNDDAVRAHFGEHVSKLFEYAERPPWDAVVLRHEPHCWTMLVCFDHLLLDGESLPILFEELALAYEERPLPLATSSYYDWSARQERELLPIALEKSAHLANHVNPGRAVLPRLDLEIAESLGASELRVVSDTLPTEITTAVTDVARGIGCTFFQVLLLAFAWSIDIVRKPGPFGVVTPVANRSAGETQRMVGWISNMAFVPLIPDWSVGFREALGQVRRALIAAAPTATVPLRVIQEHHWAEDSPVERVPGLYLAYWREEEFDRSAGDSRWQILELEDKPFLLAAVSLWAMHRQDGTLKLTLGYDAGKISRSHAENMLGSVITMLTSARSGLTEPLNEMRSRELPNYGR